MLFGSALHRVVLGGTTVALQSGEFLRDRAMQNLGGSFYQSAKRAPLFLERYAEAGEDILVSSSVSSGPDVVSRVCIKCLLSHSTWNFDP